MGSPRHHAKIAEENARGAQAELKKKRHANVGLLALRALEQSIEACAAREGLHFHEHPPAAHKNRRAWLEKHHPDLVVDWEILWGIYGELGYGGVDGQRAQQAVTVLSRVLGELRRREKIGRGLH